MRILFLIGVVCACKIRPGPLYDCRQNNLTKFELPAERFWKADFSYNNVVELAGQTFVNRDVSIFIFSGIRVISANAFNNLPNTSIIYILSGQLTSIQPNAFVNMPKFVHIYISNNNPVISCFPWQNIIALQILEVTLYTDLQTISTRTNKTECGSTGSSSGASESSWSMMFTLICIAVGMVILIAGVVYLRRATVILPLPPPDNLYDNTPPLYFDVNNTCPENAGYPGQVMYETSDNYTFMETIPLHFPECPKIPATPVE